MIFRAYRHSTRASNVITATVWRRSLLDIWPHIREWGHMPALIAREASFRRHILSHTLEYIPVKNHMHAISVTNYSVGKIIWMDTEEYIPERDPLNVLNVRKPSLGKVILINIEENILHSMSKHNPIWRFWSEKIIQYVAKMFIARVISTVKGKSEARKQPLYRFVHNIKKKRDPDVAVPFYDWYICIIQNNYDCK